MILVCRNHVTDGLKEISAPHIEKLTSEEQNYCEFCEDKAVYRLFYFSPIPAVEKRELRNKSYC
ncbi:hypothetical protein [Bacillus tuaregi]|uniref:hypothetical protein n=1 Tax=Bacillus tuaregi TaxID=1816695 RepID=UPI0008F7F951|nr:hypothetical protein [Bacillus tuaregi]